MISIIHILKIIYRRFCGHKRIILLYTILTIMLSLGETVRISLIYPILNYGMNNESSNSILDQLFDLLLPDWVNNFVGVAILLLITTCIVFILNLLVIYIGSKTTSIINYTTDKDVFTTIKNKPYDYFVQHKQGDLLYVGQRAVDESANVVINLLYFIQSGILSLFYLGLLLFLSLPLTILVIILGLLYTIIFKKILVRRVYGNSLNMTDRKRDRSVIYNEFITGIKTIFINDIIDFWMNKYDNAINAIKGNVFRINTLSQIPSLVNNFLIFLMVSCGAIILFYYTGGDFYPFIPLFGTFLFGLYRLLPVFTRTYTSYIAIIERLPALQLVDDLLLSEDSEKLALPQKPFSFNRSISFEDVTFSYQPTLPNTIERVSFEIQKNTKVAIVGSSGAGKTTIANLIALLYHPTSGQILIDRTDISELNKKQYLQALGYIGQESFIFHGSIRDNILFGQQTDEEVIIQAAKMADAHEFITKTPDGYDTIIGDQGMKLSGGQRQRIAIARVIIRSPEILLLDEATSSLDNISEEKVMEAIDRIALERTVIIIAHRLSTVQNADVIHVLKNGKIVESGTHFDLLERKGEYYNLYVKQDTE